jgi:hypothetical protein
MYHEDKTYRRPIRIKEFKLKRMDKFTLRQPAGNNQCGFYVMWAMHGYTNDDLSPGELLARIQYISILFTFLNSIHSNYFCLQLQQRQELNTRELLDMEMVGMQEEIAGFIKDKVAPADGEFNLLYVHGEQN